MKLTFPQTFHLVTSSPWPLVMSLSISSLFINVFMYVLFQDNMVVLVSSIISLIICIFQWMRDIVRESTFQGNHSTNVCKGLYMGMLMFISSEIMFFFSFFFSYFSLALNPDINLGSSWPPTGIEPVEFMMVPLLNTLILLSSGVSITWSHCSMIQSLFFQTWFSLLITILAGLVFLYFQFLEYHESSFSFTDSAYGSIFFITTGFHGIHVILGVMMISVSMKRVVSFHFSKDHHLGFEASSWYWHFVDVVWLFLFVSMYWWGS